MDLFLRVFFRFVRVPGDYYDKPLEYRMDCLNVSDVWALISRMPLAVFDDQQRVPAHAWAHVPCVNV